MGVQSGVAITPRKNLKPSFSEPAAENLRVSKNYTVYYPNIRAFG